MTNREKKLRAMFQQISNGKGCEHCRGVATESHHIIRKNASEVLRFDPANAYYVCHKCHCYIENIGQKKDYVLNLISGKRREYLKERVNILIKDYLIEHNLSLDEFYDIMEEKLKKALKSNARKL